MNEGDIILAACMMVVAAVYSSVGHAGATSYLALMALFGLSPAIMRPTALLLNVIVASLASMGYLRAGLFRWRTLWPFLIGAIPFAALGGMISLPGDLHKQLIGIVLLLSGLRLLWPKGLRAISEVHEPPIPTAIAFGAAIGFLSGLSGTGGGIFLSPLLLFFAWCEPKPASGVASVFILANSAAGLAGNVASMQHLPESMPLFAGAVAIGAIFGTVTGISLSTPIVIQVLGVVLLSAAVKLIGFY